MDLPDVHLADHVTLVAHYPAWINFELDGVAGFLLGLLDGGLEHLYPSAAFRCQGGQLEGDGRLGSGHLGSQQAAGKKNNKHRSID